jgi:hypothetical protein
MDWLVHRGKKRRDDDGLRKSQTAAGDVNVCAWHGIGWEIARLRRTVLAYRYVYMK